MNKKSNLDVVEMLGMQTLDSEFPECTASCYTTPPHSGQVSARIVGELWDDKWNLSQRSGQVQRMFILIFIIKMVLQDVLDGFFFSLTESQI